MAQGIPLTEWQTTQIRAAWLLTGSAAHGAVLAGVNPRTAQRYVNAHREELAALAVEKKPDLGEALAAVANRLVAAMLDGKKIADASLKDAAIALGIVVDKRQLLTGQATERHERRDLSGFSADELVALSALKRKQLAMRGGG